MQLKTVARSKELSYYEKKRDSLVQKEKLIMRLKAKTGTFTFDDAETLLGYLGYRKTNKEKGEWFAG